MASDVVYNLGLITLDLVKQMLLTDLFASGIEKFSAIVQVKKDVARENVKFLYVKENYREEKNVLKKLSLRHDMFNLNFTN